MLKWLDKSGDTSSHTYTAKFANGDKTTQVKFPMTNGAT